MRPPVSQKRLEELRLAAEVGLRMAGLQPHTVHVVPEELAAMVEEIHVLRIEVANLKKERSAFVEAHRG